MKNFNCSKFIFFVIQIQYKKINFIFDDYSNLFLYWGFPALRYFITVTEYSLKPWNKNMEGYMTWASAENHPRGGKDKN